MSDITLEEFEQQQSTPKPLPKAEDLKLDAEDLPEGIKGKTAAELAAEVDSLKKAFKASEEMRITMQAGLQSKTEAPPPPPPVQQNVPKWPTREEISEMLKDPEKQMDAIQIINQMALQNAGEVLEKRFAPLTEGVVGAAKTNARSRYPLEFELFGSEIENFVKSIPNKEAFSSDQGWDDAVAYVRGKSGNLEKYFATKTERERTTNRDTARNAEAESVGFSGTGSVAAPVRVAGKQLDALQLEICKVAGWDPADYAKFMD